MHSFIDAFLTVVVPCIPGREWMKVSRRPLRVAWCNPRQAVCGTGINSLLVLTLLILRLLSSKAQWCKDLWKPSWPFYVVFIGNLLMSTLRWGGDFSLTLPMLRLLSSKAQIRKDLLKPSKPYHVCLHGKTLDKYYQMSTDLPGFQWFPSFFRFILYSLN